MPDLSFAVDAVRPEPHAASPLLLLSVSIANADASQPVHSIALRCQVQIEAARRRYTPAEQSQLADLFGEPDRWGRTVGSLLWTHTSAAVPPFSGATTVDLPLPCTFDFNVAATKYFYALHEQEIPLLLLFSGTVFYQGAAGNLQVSQISWDKEARYRLPVAAWRQMMDLYYPNSAWLRIRQEVFDRLHDFKTRSGLPTWEAALERLLADCDEQVTS